MRPVLSFIVMAADIALMARVFLLGVGADVFLK